MYVCREMLRIWTIITRPIHIRKEVPKTSAKALLNVGVQVSKCSRIWTTISRFIKIPAEVHTTSAKALSNIGVMAQKCLTTLPYFSSSGVAAAVRSESLSCRQSRPGLSFNFCESSFPSVIPRRHDLNPKSVAGLDARRVGGREE